MQGTFPFQLEESTRYEKGDTERINRVTGGRDPNVTCFIGIGWARYGEVT